MELKIHRERDNVLIMRFVLSVLNDIRKESLIKPSKDMNYIFINNYIAIGMHYGMMSHIY